MSDGYAEFPSTSVDLHLNCKTFLDKITFYAVGFGNTSTTLNQIAKKMPNGDVVNAPTAKELTGSFIKVVINLYGKE